MYHIVFEYKDSYSRGWQTQECVVESLKKCREIYGLGSDPDCEYNITLVEEV